MIFTPLRNDFWYAIRNKKSPDKIILDWEHSAGEFSLEREEAFNKHLKKLEYLTNYFKHLNGTRIKKVLEQEPVWYGKPYIHKLSLYKISAKEWKLKQKSLRESR